MIIAVSHMIAGRLAGLGIDSIALTGLRYPPTLTIAILAKLAVGRPEARSDAEALPAPRR